MIFLRAKKEYLDKYNLIVLKQQVLKFYFKDYNYLFRIKLMPLESKLMDFKGIFTTTI